MRNIQHDMDLGKQLRKAYADHDDCVRGGRLAEARYVLDLIWLMWNAYLDGLPEPWSNYRPMVREEFG